MKLFRNKNNAEIGLDKTRQKEKYLFVFLVSFAVMMVVFLPIMIYDKGYFFYYGDFNSQQQMFYDHVQKAVKNGTLNWDWGTDLGSSYVGSYAFYLLGSPFFWLTTLFPKGAAPYLIPWLLALKTAVAALTSYAYIRRFVRSPEASAVGAFLYAFSGFQIYNVFFNHFHDVTALFPLMLLALEMRVQDDKRGVFALTVGLMATVNYFFFAGQITFLIIYFICRCLSKDFKITLRKFISLAIESVIGVMLSAVLLLPAVYAILENPRVDSMLSGIDMVVYDDKFRIIRIIQSFFMMSDPPARSNLFSSDTARWASIAGYLPLFSMAGVIAFLKTKKSHWAKRVVVVCIICAFVPFLNTSFYMFNSSYYARWYYMPILIMAMMTAYVVDRNREKDSALTLKKGVPIVTAATAVFLVVGLLPKLEKEKYVFFKIAKYYDLYWIQMGVSLAFLVALCWLAYGGFQKKKYYFRVVTIMTIAAVSVYSAANVWYGAAQGPYAEVYTRQAINGGEQVQLPKTEGEFYRIDTSENMDNYCMFWGYSSMRCFQSVVTPSIMEFYIEMGQQRDVATRIEPKYYFLRGLLSVKYYVQRKPVEKGKSNEMPGFEKIDETEDFIIYENKNYLPMGFAYDTYMTEDEFKALSTQNKTAALLDSLVISPQQYEKYSDIITKRTRSMNNSPQLYETLCNEKRAQSCYYFKEDNDGFTAKISLDEDKLVFFSVPYDKGFTATVNGEAVEIEKVSNGMMAVRVPKGDDSVIRFDFETVGLKTGAIITACGAALWIIYMLVGLKLNKKKEKVPAKRFYDYDEAVSADCEITEEKE